MKIPEQILHFIWRFRLFKPFHLVCQGFEEIEVIYPGNYNTDAGPDFLFAQLKINGDDWHGHVEIHVDAEDWVIHGHDTNEAYNAVILHVVWEQGKKCFSADGQLIPCLELKGLVDADLLDKIERLLQNTHWLPCSYGLMKVSKYQKIQVLNRMGVERLEHRYEQVMLMLKSYRGDWERLCLSLLAGSFGMRVNKQAFQDLSQIINLKLLQKMKGNSEAVHCLFFGQAGFLKSYKGHEAYILELKEQYQYLKNMHKLNEMNSFQWKFMRMRPHNFPTIKLAQLAAMYSQFSSWFSLLGSAINLEELKGYCQSLEIPGFWENHFHLEKETKIHSPKITDQFFDILAINGFVLVLFAYGKYIGSQEYMDKAISWLEELKPEVNSVSKRYIGYGLSICNAMESQAVLHLRANYCNPKRCLECGIGLAIIKRD